MSALNIARDMHIECDIIPCLVIGVSIIIASYLLTIIFYDASFDLSIIHCCSNCTKFAIFLSCIPEL